MNPSDPEIVSLVDQAKQFAALSGTFDPKKALTADSTLDESTIVEVATALAAKCDTNPDCSEGWLLRTAERRYILHKLRADGNLEEAVQQRRAGADVDPETDDLLLALLGEHPFGKDDIARDLATAIGFIVARSISWLRPVAFRARTAGKIVTALQLATLIALIVRQDLVNTLVLAVGLTSVVAIVDYTLLLWRERERTPA